MPTQKVLSDLEKRSPFYSACHSHPVNMLSHMLFVWPIFYTSLLLFHVTPPFLLLPCASGNAAGLPVNLGLLVACIFGAFYVRMDRKAGSLAAILCVACWASSDCLAARLGFSRAWNFVMASQLFLWTGQFLGHGLYEKRAPALLDNLVQALVTAPFFVPLELFHRVCGYEPYPGLHGRVCEKIAAAQKERKEANEKNS